MRISKPTLRDQTEMENELEEGLDQKFTEKEEKIEALENLLEKSENERQKAKQEAEEAQKQAQEIENLRKLLQQNKPQ